MNNATYYNVQNIRKNIFTAWLFFYSTLSKAWFLQHLWKKEHNTNLLLYYTLLSTYYAPGIPCIFCSRLTMVLWRQCCYYLHFINEEMEDWEVKVKLSKKYRQDMDLSLLWSKTHALPTAWNSKGTLNITVTLVSTEPSPSLVSRGITLAINSFIELFRMFSPLLQHFHHPSFLCFLPLMWALSSSSHPCQFILHTVVRVSFPM